LATESLAFGRETPALVVRETEALAAKLFLEDSVLLDEVLDDLRLVAVDPARERGEEELMGRKSLTGPLSYRFSAWS
jgi:hypothetical protein